MNGRTKERSLRRLAQWQENRVDQLRRRVAEAGAIVERMNKQLEYLKTMAAQQETAAHSLLFSLGPQQAAAAMRHLAFTRDSCERLEKNSAEAAEMFMDLRRKLLEEHTLKRQAQRLATRREKRRRATLDRFVAAQTDELILSEKFRNGGGS